MQYKYAIEFSKRESNLIGMKSNDYPRSFCGVIMSWLSCAGVILSGICASTDRTSDGAEVVTWPVSGLPNRSFYYQVLMRLVQLVGAGNSGTCTKSSRVAGNRTARVTA
jgi:hypothetical protein